MRPPHESIKQYHQLNAKKLSLLNKLCADCRRHDGNLIPFYPHLLSQHRNTACNILCYQRDQLIGFLSIFFFYQDACEIVLMVAPHYRRKGLATRLLKRANPLLKNHPIKTIIFPSPSGLNDAWLLQHGFYYQISEYEMQRTHRDPISLEQERLTIRDATENDIPILCDIDNACFPLQSPYPSLRFQEILCDPQYKVFIAFKEGLPIGKAHIATRQHHNFFSDIAILPAYQGQGYGGFLMGYCINACLNSNSLPIKLNVETTNQQALTLYSRQGFNVTNAYDYWAISAANFTTN